MKTIRVLIADDHTIVRIGLKALLGAEKDIEIVGEAKNGEMAVKEAMRLQPDVVIMDLMMPKMDGAAATAALRDRLPEAKVIILTTFGSSDGIAHAIESGAAGALMKTADDAALCGRRHDCNFPRDKAAPRGRSPDSCSDFQADRGPPVNDERSYKPRHSEAARDPSGRRKRTRGGYPCKNRSGKPHRSRRNSAAQTPSETIRISEIESAGI